MTSTKALVMRKTGNNEGRKPLPYGEEEIFMEKKQIDYVLYDRLHCRLLVFYKGSRKGERLFVDEENGYFLPQEVADFMNTAERIKQTPFRTMWVEA